MSGINAERAAGMAQITTKTTAQITTKTTAQITTQITAKITTKTTQITTAETLAMNLRRLRKQRNLTRKQLAQAARVPYNTIRNYERIISTKTLDTIEALADALNVGMWELLTEPNKMRAGMQKKGQCGR